MTESEYRVLLEMLADSAEVELDGNRAFEPALTIPRDDATGRFLPGGLDVCQNPLSTFSIDVDTASYANVRRFLAQSMLPPKDAFASKSW